MQNFEITAVHRFEPIGALVCDELFQDVHGDLRSAVFEIAHSVGASEADAQAFFEIASTS